MNKVAYQGEPGAYSEMACGKFFPEQTELLPSHTFAQVFQRIQTGEAGFGVIPVENSLYGSVFETYDLLAKYPHKIIGELTLGIHHYLMGYKKYDLSDIRCVYSHPQALGQCSDFLNSLKDVQVIPVYDTAGAAKNIRDKKEEYAAAIASRPAADEYGLKVIKGNIGNSDENYTRFLLLAPEKYEYSAEGENLKTSICFELKSAPGSLFKALSVFALRDIDLTKIESRPIPHKTFQYFFYLDLLGGTGDKKVVNAINHLKEIAESVKILGSYKTGKKYK